MAPAAGGRPGGQSGGRASRRAGGLAGRLLLLIMETDISRFKAPIVHTHTQRFA